MKNLFKIIIYMTVITACLPIVATLFIKPDRTKWQKHEKVENSINSAFLVIIYDEKGTFEYLPEDIVPFMAASIVPYNLISEADDESAVNEYYKALTVVCRTNLVKVWKDEGCPQMLDYAKTSLSEIVLTENTSELSKLVEASNATSGVVITDNISNDKDGEVIAAPFFTSTEGDILANEAGNGVGLSLNFALVKAQEGLDFVAILQSFYEGMGLSVL